MDDNTIELRMTDDEYAMIIRLYVERAMGEASQQRFDEEFEATGDIKDALYVAVINEFTNCALEQYINHEKGKQHDGSTTDNDGSVGNITI